MADFSLYEITNGFTQLMLDDEISENNKLKIQDELTLLLQQKSQSIIAYEKNLEASIEAFRNEEKRLAENRKNLENKLEKFKNYVKECMENAGISKVETSLGTISIRKSPTSIEVTNIDAIPSTYIKTEVTTKVDKAKIILNFKETGEMLDGVKYNTTNTNLQIK